MNNAAPERRGHGHHRGRHRGRHRARRRGGSLRKVLFIWFLVSLAVTAFAAALTHRALDDGEWRDQIANVEHFVERQWAHQWHSAANRERLARDFEETLPVRIGLRDAQGEVLRPTSSCDHSFHRISVQDRDGSLLGEVEVCMQPPPARPERMVAIVLVALMVLMFMSGALAYRISAPIRRVAAVAKRLADGELDARVGPTRGPGEAVVLAAVFDRMADRLESMLRDQQELLAHVSHELRTPLGHLRLLTGIGQQGDEVDWSELEREVDDLEELVAQLLARSRVDLEIMERRDVDIVALARRALERQGVPTGRVVADEVVPFSVDPSLIERALANLVRNAETHGGGVTEVRVKREDGELHIEVADAGPGANPDPNLPAGRGLGLGLPLVMSICELHGGVLEEEELEPGHLARMRLREA